MKRTIKQPSFLRGNALWLVSCPSLCLMPISTLTRFSPVLLFCPRACCCCLVIQSCPTLRDPMDQSMPGPPVFHCLLKLSIFPSKSRGGERDFPKTTGALKHLLHYAEILIQLLISFQESAWIIATDMIIAIIGISFVDCSKREECGAPVSYTHLTLPTKA